MIIVQTIIEGNHGSKYPYIETIAAVETGLEAHQAAIDYCQQGNYETEKRIIETTGRFMPTEHSGKNWSQIAPMGYERTREDGSVVWIRIEEVS